MAGRAWGAVGCKVTRLVYLVWETLGDLTQCLPTAEIYKVDEATDNFGEVGYNYRLDQVGQANEQEMQWHTAVRKWESLSNGRCWQSMSDTWIPQWTKPPLSSSEKWVEVGLVEVTPVDKATKARVVHRNLDRMVAEYAVAARDVKAIDTRQSPESGLRGLHVA